MEQELLLYHGADRPFKTLKANQLTRSPSRSFLEVFWRKRGPIYLTPSLSFALFFGSKKWWGKNMISIKKGIVYFSSFNPEKDVYIHVVDISNIPKEKLVWINERELAVHLKEITPVRVETNKAGEISRYLEIVKDRKEFLLRRNE